MTIQRVNQKHISGDDCDCTSCTPEPDYTALRAERFATFSAAYRAGLLAAVLARPHDYMIGTREKQLPNGTVRGEYVTETPEQYAERVAVKILAVMADRPYGVNYDSDGFRRACKALGIRATRKAILAYINGVE